MRFAYLGSIRVHISEYTDEMSGKITCSEGHPLIARRGSVVVHHFAHKANCSCPCSSGMSEWHTRFQDRATRDTQEVRVISDGKVHIADTLVESKYLKFSVSGTKGYVIEYQHSPMDECTMKERERFYTSQGYHLVWVFDASDWTYKCSTTPSGIRIYRQSGSKYPLLGSYTGNITKILDFNKRDMFVVKKQSGMSLTGNKISMEEFDQKYLGAKCMPNNDIRPFNHPL